MTRRSIALVLGFMGPWSSSCALEPGAGRLSRTSLGQLKATEGELLQGKQGRLLIEDAKVRAIVPASLSQVAELRFTFLGGTHSQQALASGELRQQVGLKLRAQDGCNVVYVMWRRAPKPGLVVSVKSNPRQHASLECGNRGYVTVAPRQQQPVPVLVPEVPHTLRAELEGPALRVLVDEVLVWEGELPPQALAFDGPVGLRTDNGRFELELFAHLP